ncbi:hypothetical protein CRUP_021078, partial [Coryphaenoides rupestris]
PSAAHWQLEQWLQKAQRRSSSNQPDARDPSSQVVPASAPSPQAPSPARSWGHARDYSPSQSPVPSPHFGYSPRSSPLLSPGYSFCPSPFPSTCPSPSPRHSPDRSPLPPAAAAGPSPRRRRSPGGSRSPSPGARRRPPRSPGVVSPSRYAPVPGPRLTSASPHRTKVGTRVAPTCASETKGRQRNSPCPKPPAQHPRPKTRLPQDRTLSKSSGVSSSTALRPDPSPHRKVGSHPQPSSTHHLPAPRTKHGSRLEHTPGSRPSHGPRSRPTSQPSPSRTKHLPSSASVSGQEAARNARLTSQSGSSSKASAGSSEAPAVRGSSRFTVPKSKPREDPTPAPPQKKSQAKDPKEAVLTRVDGRSTDRTEGQRRHTGWRQRGDDRRLAEEQLRRRSWIQTSEEEEEEEGGAKERQRREEADREEKRQSRSPTTTTTTTTTTANHKQPPASCRSALTNGTMKHLENQDTRRKRKSENGVSHRESKRGAPYAKDPAASAPPPGHRNPAQRPKLEVECMGVSGKPYDATGPYWPQVTPDTLQSGWEASSRTLP